MSDYYKLICKKLIKEGKKREIPVLPVLLLVFGLLTSLSFITMIMSKNPRNEDSQVLVLLMISVVLLFLSQRETFKTAVKNVELSRDVEISEKNLNALISEIEKSIKETLSTMKWAFGLIGTFVILANTLYWNGFFQSVIKIADEDEIKDFVNTDTLFSLFNLVLLFGGVLLSAYFIVTLVLVKKKSMLYLLYNVRYINNEGKLEGVL